MKTIYIDIDEEITSVIDRIRHLTDQEIILVIPRRALLCQSLVNLRLLKSQADILSRNIIIVTTDQLGKHLAIRAGLEVREKVGNHSITEIPVENISANNQSSSLNQVSPDPNHKNYNQSNLRPSNVNSISVADIIRRARSQKLYPLRKDKTAHRFKKLRAKQAKTSEVKSAQYPSLKLKKNYHRSNATKLSSLSAKLGLGFIGISLILILLIVFLILPKATINIVPKTEKIVSDVNIVVRGDLTNVDTLSKAIPGQILTLEKQESKLFLSSGKKQIPEKARGEVTLYNELGVSQRLVATTRLMSSENILFRTDSQVTIPPASVGSDGKITPGTIQAKVAADIPGPQGNINPSNFYIVAFPEERRQKIYAKSITAFTGGTTKDSSYVTVDDIENAKKELADNLASASRNEIKSGLDPNFDIPEGALNLEIAEATSSKQPNEEGENFDVQVKIKLTYLVFSPREAKELALNAAAQSLEAGKYILDLSANGLSYKLENSNLLEKKALLIVHLEKNIAWKINSEEVKNKIAGTTGEKAQEYLVSLPQIEKAEVRLWPFWVKKVPSLNKKIELKVLNP